ncbi:MAG: transglutaminase domain-containing protein [Lachnospiraceae bacterium]|nr:transglutaminase domain-containing protein [Lachnospiraceae bacterium]
MFLQKFNFGKKNKYVPATPFCGYDMAENNLHDKRDSLIHCTIKGLLIFSATFGCISGVLSEFDIIYNYVNVFIVLFLFSMAISLIHIKKWIFNVGYPVIFVLFSTMLLRYRVFVNSGFQALTNIINEEYSAHFLMQFTRESTETITDRYLTITMAAIFIGIFLAILINVGIFNDMYFLITFNLTFWPLQLGIYIGKYPSFLSLGFLFFSYFAVYTLKHSGHYIFVYPEKKPKYTLSYKRWAKEGTRHYVFYKSNARNMMQLCLFALVISLFFSSFAMASVPRSQNEAAQSGALKQRADEYVQIFVRNGLYGLFNRYEAAGGISNGRLGGVSSVRPDYQTDLIVTFVPYAYETVYLKAFTGQEYTSSKWNEPGEGYLPYRYMILEGLGEDAPFVESRTLQTLMESYVFPPMSGKMIIENVDAGMNHVFLPYYTSSLPSRSSVSKESIIQGLLAEGNSMEVEYIPYSPSQTDLTRTMLETFQFTRDEEEQDRFDVYQLECYENYLQIPENIREEIMSYHDQIGTSEDLNEQIFLIRNFFFNNYNYTLSPGATPWNKDFVTYFLSDQKEGYCAHFASAATLLFRSYGIPARYIEGYVISQYAISERAALTDYNYEDFFQGENILGASNVVEVEVNDGDAHAWVEIFVDGCGWVPIEVTPPSQDAEETTYADFLSALSGLLDSDQPMDADAGNTATDTISRLFSSLQFQNSPIITVFILILAAALLSPVLLTILRSLRAYLARKKAYREGRYDICIAYAYQKFVRRLHRKYPEEKLTLPKDVAALLTLLEAEGTASFAAENAANTASIEEIIDLTEEACFSSKQVTQKDADFLIAYYKKRKKRI